MVLESMLFKILAAPLSYGNAKRCEQLVDDELTIDALKENVEDAVARNR